MPDGSSSAAGDVGFARTGSRITRAIRPSAARAETRGPRPTSSVDRDRRRACAACTSGPPVRPPQTEARANLSELPYTA
jgi:hypothetical protein